MKLRTTPVTLRGTSAFSLIELMVAVCIITVLATLAFGGVRLAQDKARTIQCVANLRQIFLGVTAYSQDNDGRLPVAYGMTPGGYYADWRYVLARSGYFGKPDYNPGIDSSIWNPNQFKILGCPKQRSSTKSPPYTSTYGMNANLCDGQSRWVHLSRAQETLLAADGLGSGSSFNPAFYESVSLPPATHPNSTANLLYCDGHVASMPVSQLILKAWPPDSPQWIFWWGR